MIQTGIIRRIDDLGRVVIPKEIRRVSHIKEGDPLEIFPTDEGILLKRYDSSKTVMDVLRNLKHVVNDLEELSCRNEVLDKIQELTAVFKAEQKKYMIKQCRGIADE